MPDDSSAPAPEQLDADERSRLRRAHEHLRTASQELQALIATEPIRNRWEPEPAPPEILMAARAELSRCYEELEACHRELLGWESPPATA
jgi:hypothetical protein